MKVAPEKSHSYSTTHVELPKAMADRIRAVGAMIPSEDLAEDGIETKPHITVKYGLDGDSPIAASEALKDEIPATFHLGDMKVFPATADRQSDVLVVGVDSPDLHRLNRVVSGSTPHIDTHAGYTPHATVAYLKPGSGEKYAGRDGLSGLKGVADEVIHSSRSGQETRIPLKGSRTELSAANNKSTALMLGSPSGEFAPALTLGADWKHPNERNGKPCFYYWKEALSPGRFIDSEGKPFEVAPERIDAIIDNYKLAASRGYEPPLPDSHYPENRKRNFGWIVDAKKNGKGNLELLHQFVGEQEKNDALNFKTSICTLHNFKDEKDNHYGEFLDHNAITAFPHLNNLSGFVPALAASRGPVSATYLTPASDWSPMMKLTDEQRQRLMKHVPAGSTIPDEPDNDWFVKCIESRADQQRTALSRFEALEGENRTLKEEAVALRLSREKIPVAIHPEVAYERRKRISQAIDALSEKGYAPPTVTALKGEMLGTETAPNLLMLSREKPDDMASPVRAEKLIEILAANTPTPVKGVMSGLMLSQPDANDPEEKERKTAHDAGYAQGKAYKDQQLASRGLT
jgi:2'-5' RNA ligase